VTEAEWDTCEDPTPMLEFLRGKASDRKLRLFACACCRAIWQHLAAGELRQAVETAEGYADGAASKDDLRAIHNLIAAIAKDAFFHGVSLAGRGEPKPFALQHAAIAVAEATSSSLDGPHGDHDPAPGECAASVAAQSAHHQNEETYQAERSRQAELVRDIFGSPFRPAPALDPSWLAWNGCTVAKLAAAIYDERRFADLPILADALEDAGCADAAILAHCRGPGEHVRGCWVVDLLTGRQ
jgi:hypothetical protein